MDYKKIFKRETKVIAYIVICLTLVVIGTSYALFLQVSNNSNNQIVKAGSLTITYSGGNTISTEENNCLEPQSDSTGSKDGCNFELSITNEGTLPMQYDLLIYDNEQANGETLVSHEFIRHSLKKQLNASESSETVTDAGPLSGLNAYNSTTKKILDTNVINPGETIVFSLKIWIDGNVDESVIGQTVNLKLDVVGTVYEEPVVSLSEGIKVGDYVEMTPTSTSYTINKEETGCTESSFCNGVADQTINPSELNLWRVIKKNEDGTIELVSEEVSSDKIIFGGVTGYMKYIGTLNTIAKQYENTKYTIGSRYIGFNGQTEILTDATKFETRSPWETATESHGNDYESLGGGDILYEEDINLIQNALNTLSTPSNNPYLMASREYNIETVSSYGIYGRVLNGNPFSIGRLQMGYYRGGWYYGNSSYSLRPIVILKSGLQAQGAGTSENHWRLVD